MIMGILQRGQTFSHLVNILVLLFLSIFNIILNFLEDLFLKRLAVQEIIIEKIFLSFPA